MAKLPPKALEEKEFDPMFNPRLRRGVSPLEEGGNGRTVIRGNTVTYHDGTKIKYQDRKAAWAAYQQEKKDRGEKV